MLIGLRLLLMVAIVGCSATLLGYLFTRNPRFLEFTKLIIKVAVLLGAAIALIYVLERVILA